MGGQTPHRPDIGDNRENIIIKFLNNHLPDCLRAVQGGVILSHTGITSGQIDVIIINNSFPKFEHNNKSYILAESVVKIISVKSKLDVTSLTEALNNINTVPDYCDASLKVKVGITSVPELTKKMKSHWPLKYVFAFDGTNLDGIYGRLTEFVQREKIPVHRFTDTLIINKKLHAMLIEEPTKIDDGTIIQPYTYWGSKIDNDSDIGFPLFKLIVELNKYVDWIPHLQFDYGKYYNTVVDERSTSTERQA